MKRSQVTVGTWHRGLGYSGERHECYVATGPVRVRSFPVSIFVPGEPPRSVAELSLDSLPRAFYDVATNRVVLTEHAEAKEGDPHGFLVDLGAAVVSPPFRIPRVNYGVAFDPDGRTLYHSRCRPGELWAVDSETGATTTQNQVGAMGFPIGVVDDRRLARLRVDALDFYARHTLRRLGSVKVADIDPGIALVEGSRIVRGKVIVRGSMKQGGMLLFVVELADTYGG